MFATIAFIEKKHRVWSMSIAPKPSTILRRPAQTCIWKKIWWLYFIFSYWTFVVWYSESTNKHGEHLISSTFESFDGEAIINCGFLWSNIFGHFKEQFSSCNVSTVFFAQQYLDSLKKYQLKSLFLNLIQNIMRWHFYPIYFCEIITITLIQKKNFISSIRFKWKSFLRCIADIFVIIWTNHVFFQIIYSQGFDWNGL